MLTYPAASCVYIRYCGARVFVSDLPHAPIAFFTLQKTAEHAQTQLRHQEKSTSSCKDRDTETQREGYPRSSANDEKDETKAAEARDD